MEVRFNMGEIAGADVDEFAEAVKHFARKLDNSRVSKDRTRWDAQEILNASLCILVAKLHERVVYLEQFAPVKTKNAEAALQ